MKNKSLADDYDWTHKAARYTSQFYYFKSCDMVNGPTIPSGFNPLEV